MSVIAKIFPFLSRSVSDRDELADLIETSLKETVAFDSHEGALLRNMLGLRDITAEDVMVPRADIMSVDLSMDFQDIFNAIVKAGHSRVPCHNGSMDNLVGFLHIKDLMAGVATGEIKTNQSYDLSKLLRPVLFVSPSIRLLDLLHEMRLKRQHLALVVDEFGGVDGLITIEDLVEEIVGEIEDEHDEIEDEMCVKIDENTFEVSARMEIDALEKEININISSEQEEDFDTVGGLIFCIVGRVPGQGEIVSHPCGIEFRIIDSDPRRIKKVALSTKKYSQDDA